MRSFRVGLLGAGASLCALVTTCASISGCGGTSKSLGDAGVPEAASTVDAGPGGAADASPEGSVEAGTPITAPAGQWTWIPFPDAECGDGSPVGLGVNLNPNATRVLIYLEGGGACWSELTCYTVMTAANFVAGYSQTQFVTETSEVSAVPNGFFNRSAASNPFKDDSYVFIPYCTGDMHAGNNVATYGAHSAHHVGFANFGAFLRRLAPTFPSARRVILSGSSAGGYGAVFNAWQAQRAFGSVRVDLLDDSGTFLPADVLRSSANDPTAAQRAAWALDRTGPAGCSACASDPSAIYGYYAQSFPDHRAALLTYRQDSVIPQFFGITAAEFTTGLDEDLTRYFAPNANMASFQAAGSGHVLFFQPSLATGTVTVSAFVTQMVSDDPRWASVAP